MKKKMDKLRNGSIWKMTKITLAKERRHYIGARSKVCVDIRKTQTDAILQSVVQMPLAPAIEEDVKSSVALPSLQVAATAGRSGTRSR